MVFKSIPVFFRWYLPCFFDDIWVSYHGFFDEAILELRFRYTKPQNPSFGLSIVSQLLEQGLLMVDFYHWELKWLSKENVTIPEYLSKIHYDRRISLDILYEIIPWMAIEIQGDITISN